MIAFDCHCYENGSIKNNIELPIHSDVQDKTTSSWKDLLVLIKSAAKDNREEINLERDLGEEAVGHIHTLPKEIGESKKYLL